MFFASYRLWKRREVMQSFSLNFRSWVLMYYSYHGTLSLAVWALYILFYLFFPFVHFPHSHFPLLCLLHFYSQVAIIMHFRQILLLHVFICNVYYYSMWRQFHLVKRCQTLDLIVLLCFGKSSGFWICPCCCVFMYLYIAAQYSMTFYVFILLRDGHWIACSCFSLMICSLSNLCENVSGNICRILALSILVFTEHCQVYLQNDYTSLYPHEQQCEGLLLYSFLRLSNLMGIELCLCFFLICLVTNKFDNHFIYCSAFLYFLW